MTVKCVFARAKSHFKGKKLGGTLTAKAPKYPRYPDCDNLGKFYLDVLTKVVWHDDSSITSLKVEKCYGEVAETIVTVTPIE